jgi:hypothetical protein
MRLRFLLGVLLAMVGVLAPTASVLACSCAGGMSLAATLGGNEVVLLGTVVDAVEAPAGDMGQQMAYAVQVERSSQPVAATVEVRATFGDGGASCGFEFGVGQRWFIGAFEQDGVLQTNLCSGNAMADELPEADVNEIVAMLPAEPASEASVPVAATPEIPWGPIGLGAGALLILAVTVLAFRAGPRQVK